MEQLIYYLWIFGVPLAVFVILILIILLLIKRLLK